MEKQLVDALKSVNRISELDEVSKDMIAHRAYNLWEKFHDLVDAFADGFAELAREEPELTKLVGATCIMAYTDDFCMSAAKEQGKDPIKCTIVYGKRHTTQLLHMKMMTKILADDFDDEDTDDEDYPTRNEVLEDTDEE